MEINWAVVAWVSIVNAGLCFIQYLANRSERNHGCLPPRGSLIPGTNQEFLYWQDFHTQTWGDIIGLAGPQIAFVHLVMEGYITQLQWIFLLIISWLAGLLFAFINMRTDHKPDWGFPEKGIISKSGLVHLPYFGINVVLALFLDIYHVCIGNLRGPVMYLAFAGAATYIVSCLLDVLDENFDSVRYVTEKSP